MNIYPVSYTHLKAKSQKDDLTKAKVIYDYIIENTKYVERKGKDQDVIGALLEHETVCAGYARAYQLLMNQVGVPCSYIVGDSKIETENSPGYEGHAWNMVKINDDYYYCDPTWGDDANKYGAHTCYAYFMMDSDDMLRCYTTAVSYTHLDVYKRQLQSCVISHSQNPHQ